MSPLADSDLLYEEAPCGLLVTEANGTIVRANRTFCGWLGRTSQELVGVRLQSLLSIGGRIFHQTHWEPLLKMQGSLAEVKLEMLGIDGQKIPMVMNAVVRIKDGVEYHELAIFSARDRHKYEQELLLARRRTEDHLARELESQRRLSEIQVRLELAIDAAQLYQWSVEVSDGTRHYEPEVALLVGFEELKLMEAAEFLDHIAPEDREREAREIREFLASRGDRFHTNFRLLRLDGVSAGSPPRHARVSMRPACLPTWSACCRT